MKVIVNVLGSRVHLDLIAYPMKKAPQWFIDKHQKQQNETMVLLREREAFINGSAKPIHEKVKLDVKIFQEKCGRVAVLQKYVVYMQ